MTNDEFFFNKLISIFSQFNLDLPYLLFFSFTFVEELKIIFVFKLVISINLHILFVIFSFCIYDVFFLMVGLHLQDEK